jgi:hypothetical protein
MRLATAALVVTSIASGGALAQRPSHASICDYYAEKKYGENSTASQVKLLQNIVALAFGGGEGVADTSAENTGIINPGKYNGRDVNLRPWFDGSSTSPMSCLGWLF